LSSEAITPRTACRGFFGDPAVHAMIVATTDTASSAATTMLIAFRTPSPQ